MGKKKPFNVDAFIPFLGHPSQINKDFLRHRGHMSEVSKRNLLNGVTHSIEINETGMTQLLSIYSLYFIPIIVFDVDFFA